MIRFRPDNDGASGSGGGSDPDPVPASDGGTQTPEGFVPRAEFESEQARARSFQAEADRLRAAARTPDPTPPASGTGEDVEGRVADQLAAFERRQVLREVVPTLRSEFPHADASIFASLHEYGSADALRLAVEASHQRVASIVDAEAGRREQALREEYDAKHGGSGSPPAGPVEPGADPTPEQLAGMTLTEIQAIEAKAPGVVERVLRSA